MATSAAMAVSRSHGCLSGDAYSLDGFSLRPCLKATNKTSPTWPRPWGATLKHSVERHGAAVQKQMRNFARDPALAEELAQDVFVEAYLGLAKFRRFATGWRG